VYPEYPRSERLAALTDDDIVREFHRALVALAPSLERLDLVETRKQPYDDFEVVAEELWRVLVARSLQWKYGLAAPPDLTSYGWAIPSPGPDGYIGFRTGPDKPWVRLVEFTNEREVSGQPFGGLFGLTPDDKPVVAVLDASVQFAWVRPVAAHDA
jgi:hypothetical protein